MGTTKSKAKRKVRRTDRSGNESRALNGGFAHDAHPFIVLDPEGSLIMANSSAIDIFGLSEKGTGDGSWWSEAFHHSDVDAIRRSFRTILSGGSAAMGIAHTSDKRSRLEYEMTPLHRDADELYAVAVGFDYAYERRGGHLLLAALDEYHENLGSTIDPEIILGRVIERVTADLSADGVGILVRKDDGWMIDWATGSLEQGHWFSNEDAERLFPSLIDGKIRVGEDLSKGDHLFLDELGIGGVEASIIAPLRHRGMIGGALVCIFRDPTCLSPYQIDYARSVGTGVQVALENCQALASVKREMSFLKQVIDRIPFSIALLRHQDMEITLMNAKFRGFLRGASGLNDFLARMPMEVSEKVRDVLELAHSTREPQLESELPVHTQDGGTSYYNLYFIPQAISLEGDLMVIAVDITGQVEGRREMEQLATSAELERIRLRTVLEIMPIAVMVVDSEGKIIVANEALKTFTYLSAPEVWTELPRLEGRWSNTGEKIKKDEWPVVRALRGEYVHGALTDVVIKSGEIRTIIGSASPIIMNGVINGAVMGFYDITEQRKAEQDALQARRQMELYLDLLSHDVNNMNAGAKGYMELLLKKGGLTGKPLHYAESASSIMGDIARLVENVRKLQKAEMDALLRSTIDLNHLIDNLVAMHRNTPSRHVSISFKPGEQALVSGNDLLRDVFDNVIWNAIKHSVGEVEIGITVGHLMMEGKEFIRVDITDNGPGIPNNMKKVLFTRMQRGQTTVHGHGLGLYLAKTVLEIFGGQMWVDDRIPGDHTKGARFVVLIPAACSERP